MSDDISEPIMPLEELRPKVQPKPKEPDYLHDYRDQRSNKDRTYGSFEPERT